MKCFYCHHRIGKFVISIEGMLVILCESCVRRSMTMRSLSLKFCGSNASRAQRPKEIYKIEKTK